MQPIEVIGSLEYFRNGCVLLDITSKVEWWFTNQQIMFQDYGKLFLLFVEVYWNDHIYVYHLPYQEKQTQLRVFEFQVPSLIWPFHMQVKSDRKGPQINNPMSLPRLRKCFFLFLFLFFALVKQFLPNVQVFYLGLSFGLSPVTLKYRIIFIQLIVNGPEPSYNSIILKGKN